MRYLEPKQKITIERTEPRPHMWVVSVDLGNLNDSTAISVIDVSLAWEITYTQTDFQPDPAEVRREHELSYLVRLLHRPRLNVGFPAIIAQTKSIVDEVSGRGLPVMVIMDATGLGAPVVQRARESGLPETIGLSITGGDTAKVTGRNWTAPKGLIVGELRLAMHRKLLKVAQGFAARETLETELRAFTARLSSSGRATFEAAGSEHDDTVLSLAMGVFAAKQWRQPIAVPRDWMAR